MQSGGNRLYHVQTIMPQTLDDLRQFRHALHARAERSRHEQNTAAFVASRLEAHAPDRIVTELGGHGLAAIYNGASDGPTVLIRCELDALPIPESITLEYGSEAEDTAHKCGHDGHMTMVAGLAPLLADQRPDTGRVILLFQPAEETGEGAQLVIDDPKYGELSPDYVFALHNLPGFPLGSVIVRDGVFSSASKGLIVRLTGATSHAAEPEQGRSPALAVAALINSISAAPQFATALHESAKATIIHARVGEIAFGTSPGYGEVMATLRAHDNDVMERLSRHCVELAERTATAFDLDHETEWVEPFPITAGDPGCVETVRECAGALGLSTVEPPEPFAWSEDFGNFTGRHRGALFGLGSGEEHPALHNPDYDFPDELIHYGLGMFGTIIGRLLGWRDDSFFRARLTDNRR